MTDYQTYPDRPGFKGTAETSAQAAASIAPRLGRLQRLVADAVTDAAAFGSMPEEAAEVLGLTYASVQPRFSELKEKGVIVDSGMRRVNSISGKRAVVYVLPQYAPAKPSDA